MSSLAHVRLLAVGLQHDHAVARLADQAGEDLAVGGQHGLGGELIGDDLRGEHDRFQNLLLLEAAADVRQVGADAFAARAVAMALDALGLLEHGRAASGVALQRRPDWRASPSPRRTPAVLPAPSAARPRADRDTFRRTTFATRRAPFAMARAARRLSRRSSASSNCEASRPP